MWRKCVTLSDILRQGADCLECSQLSLRICNSGYDRDRFLANAFLHLAEIGDLLGMQGRSIHFAGASTIQPTRCGRQMCALERISSQSDSISTSSVSPTRRCGAAASVESTCLPHIENLSLNPE